MPNENEISKMVSIRRMTPMDIEVIPQLDVLAFTAYSHQAGHAVPFPPRTNENILACRNLNPTGCFVAETDILVGYIFTRILGTTGWIGTFGVHPDCQGQGIGRSLLSAAVEHLQEASCITIGLETMSDSPSNIGFYSRFGFLPTFPTVLLIKETSSNAEASPYALLSHQNDSETLSAITQICEAACFGLDYSVEAYNAKEYEWGEVLLIGQPQPWAFAIVRTISKRQGSADSRADISVLVIPSKAEEKFAEALQTIEVFIHSRDFEKMSLAINTADGEALKQALNNGFQVHSAYLRMVLDGEYTLPPGRVLSSWLM